MYNSIPWGQNHGTHSPPPWGQNRGVTLCKSLVQDVCILLIFCKALRTMLLKGEGNVTPRFLPQGGGECVPWFRPHGIELHMM